METDKINAAINVELDINYLLQIPEDLLATYRLAAADEDQCKDKMRLGAAPVINIQQK